MLLIIVFILSILLFFCSYRLTKKGNIFFARGIANFFFIAGITFVSFLVLCIGAETLFFATYKTLYYNKSQMRLVDLSGVKSEKSDRYLVHKDLTDSLLKLHENVFFAHRDKIRATGNSRYSISKNEVILESLDGRPASLEVTVPLNGLKPYPYLLSFSSLVKECSSTSSPSLSIVYLDKESTSPGLCGEIFGKKDILLTVAPHYLSEGVYLSEDTYVDSNSIGNELTLRLNIKNGKAVFSKDVLFAHRQYGIFKNRAVVHKDQNRFDSAMGLFVQKINYIKNPDMRRIIFLGGSTMYGANYSTIEATIPKWFDFKLQATYPGKYEVLNLGMNGATTISMINGLTNNRMSSLNLIERPLTNPADFVSELFFFTYFDLEPDIAIIAPMYNDFISGSIYYEDNFDIATAVLNFSLKNRYLRVFFERYALGYYIHSSLKGDYQAKIAQKFIQGSDEENIKRITESYKSNLNSVVSKLKENGIRVYLTALPNLPLYRKDAVLGDQYMNYFRFLNKINTIDENIIKEVAVKNDIAYIDLRSYFSSLPQEMDKDIYVNDYVHLKSLGNAMVADILFSELKDKLQ